MIAKTENDISVLREGGRRLARVMRLVASEVRPGVSTATLDELAERLIREGGDEPAFLEYTPDGADRPFPATLCVSVNDEVVHGIPNENPRVLKEGDIVMLDSGLRHGGLFVDMAVSVPVGKVDPVAQKLIDTSREALKLGIKACVPGSFINDIGCVMGKFIHQQGFSVVEELGGHGVGKKQHELPYVPSFCMKGKSPKIQEGMVLAIEPIVNEGSPDVYLMDDGYTFRTVDGKRSAEFEHTVLVTSDGVEILTKE